MSLVCAFGPWIFADTAVLRVVAAVAAATALVGAAVMRRWDTQAGKQVADLTRARASDEWRYEERVAELETDLDESRELRVKLEHKLRAKRTELAGLRNEHAALLRRYATAETERATALEGRRLLELEASPTRALPPVPAAGTDLAEAEPQDAVDADVTDADVTDEAVAAPAGTDAEADTDVDADADADADTEGVEEEPETPAIFSPEGSQLFLRAKAALNRFDEDSDGPAKNDASVTDEPLDEPVESGSPAAEDTGGTEAEAAQEDEAQGKPEAVDGHSRAAAVTTVAETDASAQAPAKHTQSAQPVRQPSGHFAVPTAVAVVPAAPARRPSVEGGFDFFGTQKESSSEAMDAVQNEDLADVVGQEALALHKAEAEAQFKQADEAARAVGQVIDLTAHDETEQIDMQGLRSAAS